MVNDDVFNFYENLHCFAKFKYENFSILEDFKKRNENVFRYRLWKFFSFKTRILNFKLISER